MYPILCALGLLLGVSATSYSVVTNTGTAVWNTGNTYPTQYIAPGDSITFQFSSGHTVYLFPTQTAYTNCDFSTATQLNTGTTGPYQYSPTPAGTYYVGCNVGTHCSSGNLKVTIVVTGTTAATPTFSPNGGSVLDGTAIAVTSTTGSSITCITKDNSVPVCLASETGCANGLLVDGNNNKKATADNGNKWQAVACATGASASPVAVMTTALAAAVSNPVFSPNGGAIADTTVVSVTSTTSGAIICIDKVNTDPAPACTADKTGCIAPALVVDGNNNKKAIADNGNAWRAIACLAGTADSAVVTMASNLSTPVVANPSFSPNGGAVQDNSTVNITTTTAGATICFTKNASVPACTADKTGCTGSSFKPDGSVNLKQTSDNTMMWRAIACLSGYTDSSIVNMSTVLSTPMVANPMFSPDGGYVNDGTVVIVNTTTTGATICITKNGSIPSCSVNKMSCANGSKPDGTFNVKSSSDNSTKWMAIACWTGYLDSNVTTMTNSLATPAVGNPTFSPDGGSIADGTVVSVTDATSGANICISKNSSSPACSSDKLSCTSGSKPDGTFNKKASSDNGLKWQAIACVSGMADSQVVTMTNTISASSTQVATPTFNPNGGALADGSLITVSTTTSGATICLSRNGTAPACNAAKTGCTSGSVVTGSVAKAASDNNMQWQAIGCLSTLTDSVIGIMGSVIKASSHGNQVSVCFATVLAAMTVLSYWLI